MLSRFCNSTLKLVRLAQTNNRLRYYSMPASSISIQESVRCNWILVKLKDRVENKSRLTSNELNTLLTELRSQKVDNAQALEILQCCTFGRTATNHSKIVNDVWKELKKQDNKYQIQHYNCLLQFGRDKQDVKQVQAIFDEMVKNGVKPNALSYQCLLSTYCKAENIEKFVEILDMMDKDNLYINEGSYNDLVQCHVICGNIEAANETMSSLKEKGFVVNYFTLNTLLNHYAKSGDLINIQKTIDTFKEENIELYNTNIFETICTLASNGHIDKIDALLSYLKPNMELRVSVLSTVTLFVENKQSALVPKLSQWLSSDSKTMYNHLIKEMARLSSSETELIDTFDQIEAAGLTLEENFDIFRPALECSSEEIIRRLLKHMKTNSMDVSENTFKKLFQLSAKKGYKEVLNTANLLCHDFGIQPRIMFIRDVILPGLNVKENAALACAKLQTTQIHHNNVIVAIINDRLNNGDIKTALDFAKINQRFYGVDLIKRPLLQAYATSGDLHSFVTFVRLINGSFSKINSYYRESTIADDEIKNRQKAFDGEILFGAIKSPQSTESIIELLNAFATEGLAINTDHAEQIQSYLKIGSDTKIGCLLQKLSTEQFELKPNKDHTDLNKFEIMNQLSSADVQNILEVKLAQGHNTAATERSLFLAYIREGNTSQIESLISSNKFIISNSDYASLIDLYTRVGDLNNALNMLKRVCANNATFKLYRIRVGKLITLMVEKERSFHEIEALLLANRQGRGEHRIFVFLHLLDRLAYNGQVKLAEQLFEALLKYGYIEPTMGPLISAHLNGSYNEAVQKYEQFADTYKLAPMGTVLFNRLIRANEIDLLQRALDVYEKVNGENKALFRLAFAFVECGHERQAKAIFENDRSKNISKNITRACKHYVDYGKSESAKTLLKATKGIFCDRQIIYQSILDIYQKANKAQEALDLWIEYTADVILPNTAFKNKLTELLKTNNIDLPFDLDTNSTQEPKNKYRKCDQRNFNS